MRYEVSYAGYHSEVPIPEPPGVLGALSLA